jgi:hypothetical protein
MTLDVLPAVQVCLGGNSDVDLAAVGVGRFIQSHHHTCGTNSGHTKAMKLGEVRIQQPRRTQEEAHKSYT